MHGMDELWTCRLGTVEYREAVGLQERLRERVQAGELPDVLLLLEHPPVYTLGRLAATLAILVLGAATAIAVVTSTDTGPPVQRIEEDDVQSQVQGLKQLIEENTAR